MKLNVYQLTLLWLKVAQLKSLFTSHVLNVHRFLHGYFIGLL